MQIVHALLGQFSFYKIYNCDFGFRGYG